MNPITAALPDLKEKYPTLDLRDTWAEQGILIIKPGNEQPTGSQLSDRGAMSQCATIAESLYPIAETVGAKLAIWDTLSSDATRCLRELATARFNDASQSTRIQVKSGGVLAKMAEPTWQQRNLVQNWIRDFVRAPLIQDPKCHLFLAMHQNLTTKSGGKDSDGFNIKIPVMFGPDAGGPASAEHWGKEFSSIHRMTNDGKKRVLHLNQGADRFGVPFAARTGIADGKDLKDMPIPTGFSGCVEAHKALFKHQGVVLGQEDKYGYLTNTTYALQSCGKTWWLMCLLGIPELLPAILVASDGNSEFLRSCPQEVRNQKFHHGDSPKTEGK